MPLDVKALGCDWLTATGRKYLRGPRGSGFLFAHPRCVADKGPVPWARWEGRLAGPFLPAHVDNIGGKWVEAGAMALSPGARRYVSRSENARPTRRSFPPRVAHGQGGTRARTRRDRYESYEMSQAARVGLGVAATYALDLGVPRIWARIKALASRLREGLRDIPGVHVHDQGAVQCGIVSFTKAGVAPEAARVWLRGGAGGGDGRAGAAAASRPINVSVSRVGSSRMEFEARGLAEVLRASVHYFNSEEEVDVLLEAVRRLHPRAGATLTGRSERG